MHEKPEKIFPVYITASSPRVAARRERAMKRWRRDWKIELIENHNPTWRDLFADVLRDNGFAW
jgi:predicted GIY-YIG superfamily endonuclease